jgi:hypothetical protein
MLREEEVVEGSGDRGHAPNNGVQERGHELTEFR